MVTQAHGEYAYVGDATAIDDDVFLMSETEAHHLTRVRRVRAGDTVMATDGRGMVYACTFESPNKLIVTRRLPEFGESKTTLQLICGCLQGDTARDVVSSAVQLGVASISWVRMIRSQEEYSQHKLEKLARVAVQATKQTGRARLVEQRQFGTLRQALTELESSAIWVAHPDDSATRDVTVTDLASAQTLIVGPEGGFDATELEMLKAAQARFIRLGIRRLRSETAVISGLTLLSAACKEL